MSTQNAERPSVSKTRKAITDGVVREAIAMYNHGLRARAEAESRFGDDDALDPMMIVVECRARDAETNLVRAILATAAAPDAHTMYLEKRLLPSRGVQCDGTLYLVGPAPDLPYGMKVGEDRDDGDAAMILTVVDESDVGDVGTMENAPGLHPDGSLIYHASHMDDEAEAPDGPGDEPGPTGPRPAPEGPYHGRPLPLLRATHTLCAPWDPWPITFELIVLVEATAAAGLPATVADVPELGHGGWANHSVGPLNVFTRMIVP